VGQPGGKPDFPAIDDGMSLQGARNLVAITERQ